MSKPNLTTPEHQEDVKLEDILNSIRGMINDHHQHPHITSKAYDEDDDEIRENANEDGILELTQAMEAKASRQEESLVSDSIRAKSTSMFSNFAKVAEETPDTNNSELESAIHKLMRPMIKEWLDNNLLGIVEKIITEEVKKLIPRK